MLRRAVIIAVAASAVVGLGCVGVVWAAVAAITASGDPVARAAPPANALAPAPPPPAASRIAVPAPEELDDSAVTAHWASLTRTAAVYAEPTARAHRLGRIGGTTPERTANVVLLEGAAVDGHGTPWARVTYPGDEGSRSGWIRRVDLGPGGVSRSRLVVDRSALTLTLYRSGRLALRVPIGVGAPGTPTPAGRFYVRNRLTRYASARYGPLAFGTSARSVLSDWPGGGYIGIHGTNHPELLPGAVSHGCIRMRNHDIVALGLVLGVGTPVEIV
jgi:lipoprotein-anchoring transpeptidase ErfK/SrfK